MSAGSLVIPFARIPHFIAEDPRVKPHDLAVIRAILRVGKSSPEVVITDDGLARRSGLAKRTVQEALTRLEACDFIQRLRGGFGLFRRRIRLLWMVEKAPEKQDVPRRRDSAPGCASPEPPRPIRAEEPPKNKQTTTTELYPVAPESPDVVPVVQALNAVLARPGVVVVCCDVQPIKSGTPQARPESTRKATAIEVDKVTSRVAAHFGPGAQWRDFVIGLAKETRLSFIAAAMDWAEYSKAPAWGYVVKLARKFQRNGFPDPSPKGRRTATSLRVRPHYVAPSPTPISEDERPELLELIRSAPEPIARIARTRLAELDGTLATNGEPAEVAPGEPEPGFVAPKKTPDEVRAEFYRVIDARRRARGEERL